MSRLSGDGPLRAIVLAAWVLLAIAFNLTLGLFEGQDEAPHFLVADKIARDGALPVMSADSIAYSHEVTQPPLYYIMVALAIAPFDRTDLADEAFINPRPNDGLGYDHTIEELRFPPRGAILAVRVARMVSVVLGACTLILLGAAATLLSGRHRTGTLAMALGGFNPKFVHVFSVVSNDAAVFAWAALFLWLMVRALRPEDGPRGRALAVLGATIGLAMLSKYNGLALAFPAAALAVVPIAGRRPSLSSMAGRLLHIAAGFGFVIAPYLARNWLVYGNPLALDWVAQGNLGSLRPVPLDLATVLMTLPGWTTTYFDTIAHVLPPPALVRWAVIAVLAGGSAGFAALIARTRRSAALWLCVVTAVAGLAGWAVWYSRYAQTINIRLSGIAFPAVALITGTGAAWLLGSVLDRIRQPAAVWAAVALPAGLCASTVWLTILPSYALRPSRVPAALVRQLPAGGAVRFDNGIEILAVDLLHNKINSGEEARLTFYWRLVAWQPRAQVLALEARDAAGTSMARMTANPQPGLNTTTWGERTVYSATHTLLLTATTDTVAKLYAGFYDYEPPNTVARTIDGGASQQIGEIKVRAGRAPEVAAQQPADVIFADALRLEGLNVSGDALTLLWRPGKEPTTNVVIFIHALDADGRIVGQLDAPPAYAMTLWDAGEQVRDPRVVPGLAAAAALRVGMYDPLTQKRLPARTASGFALPEDAAIIPLRR